MDINSLGLSKRIHKNFENKNEKKPVGVDDRSMERKDKTALEKIRNSAVSSYAAAMMALGGASSLTGCVDTESNSISTVNVDMEEFKKMFQQLLDLQNQILEQLQQNSQDNKEIIKQLKEVNKVLSNIYSGVIDIKEGMMEIKDIIIESNQNDKEFIAKINEIINNQTDQNKALQEILEENKKQNAWLANIEPYIESIANISAATGDTLTKFYEAYKNGEVSHSEFNEKLLNAVINNGNISSDILAEIKGFRADFEAGKMSEAELLQKIADLLASIDGKMDVVIEKLNDINENIVKFSEKTDVNHQETMEKLGDIGSKIENGFAINQSQMNELIQLGKDGNKNTTQLLVEMQNLKDILIEIKDKDGNLKIEELLTKYGDIMAGDLKTVIDILKENQQADIKNVNDIINSINNSKTDLSKLQEQMGTVIVLLQAAQNSDISADDLLPIVEGLKKLQESNEQGNAAVNNNLSQILADMAEIKGMLNVIVTAQGETLDTLKKYASSAEVAFEQLGSDMKDLISGQVTQEKLDQSLAKVRTDMTQVEASMSQGLNLLQLILESQGKGESGMSPAELDSIVNNNQTFNDIKDLLGDLNVDRVTNTTLNNAMSTHKTDLSKIQEQLGTAIILLQNINPGNVTVDTSKLETAINELVDVVTNQGVTSNTSMKDIADKLQNLIDLTKPDVEPATRMVKLAEAKMPHNMPYRISLSQIEDAYRQSMMA